MLSNTDYTAAVTFNNKANGTLWVVAQLPAQLGIAWATSTTRRAFALEVAKLQSMTGLGVDGKLGPKTLAAITRQKVPDVQGPSLLGIDVSGYQNKDKFDFTALRTAGLSFAFVKVTQESFLSNKDAQWQTDLFYDMGLAVGFYHFCDASESAEKQAKLFHSSARKLAKGRPYLPLAADYEWLDDHNDIGQAKHRAWLPVMTQQLRDLDGRAPLLYTGPNAWKQFLGKVPLDLGETLLWAVDYSKPEAPPTLPPGFKTWTFRQFTGTGSIPGYRGDLDLNYFNGDELALKRLTRA